MKPPDEEVDPSAAQANCQISMLFICRDKVIMRDNSQSIWDNEGYRSAMGYWGWRPLAFTVFVCVWVAGCNLVSDASPSTASPTAYPRVTLTVGRPAPPSPRSTAAATAVVSAETPTSDADAATEIPSPTPVLYIVQSGDTLLDIALRFNISLDALRAANASADLSLLQPGQALVIPAPTDESIPEVAQASPTPLSLNVQPPTCYDTRAGTILCLGLVENTQETAAGRVAVEVRLLRGGGESPLLEIATIEQALILPGSAAPYRAAFSASWSVFAGATAGLVSADATLESLIRVFTVEDQQVLLADGRFEVTAELLNSTESTLQPVRAVVTLQNERGAVIGYRVVALGGDNLPSGSRMPLQIEIVPQVYPSTAVRVTVHAEGQVV
jgi:LysM repeat protein